MLREYSALAQTFGWDREVFDQITKNALEGAFCDTDTKTRLAKQLETA
jgi:adenosine deaminase